MIPKFLFLQNSRGKDFSIFLRVRPYELRQRAVITKDILTGWGKRGVLLTVENGGFQLEMMNVFKSRSLRSLSYT